MMSMHQARSTMSDVRRGISLLFVLGLMAAQVGAQCLSNDEDPAGFTWTRNSTTNGSETTYNFANAMADPTIMKLQDAAGVTWFFVTGSCPGEKFANFRIYRSRDLVNWEGHSWVFNPAMRFPTQHSQQDALFITNNGTTRKFMHLWSPHLYYDPNYGDGMIYLTFAAAEMWDNDLDDDRISDNDLGQGGQTDSDNANLEFSQEQVTSFEVWTEKSRFLTGGSTYWVGPDRLFMPQWYTYRTNNGTAYHRDGGWNQGQVSGDGYASIPCSGFTGDGKWDVLEDPAWDRRANRTGVLGHAWKLQGGTHPRGFHWYGVGGRAWMADSPQLFFDPLNDCRPWITWTWSQRGGNLFDGNNVAGFPLLGTSHWDGGFRNADALYNNPNFPPPIQTQPLQLLFAHTTYNSMEGIPNGKVWSDHNGIAIESANGGIGEAQDVFYSHGRYYLLASRNWWNLPSYQIVYRMSSLNADSIEDLHISPWNWYSSVENVPEKVLAASDWVARYPCGSPPRDAASLTSYGHAQYFTAYGREYIIFHQGTHKWLQNPNPPYNWYTTTARHIFIKDLTFHSTTGELTRFYENSSCNGFPDYNSDVFYFRAPTNVPSGGVPVP